MARIRTVKPEFWTDSVIVRLPFEARLLFIGLWNFCDDQGFLVNEPDRLRMQVFPSEPSLDLASLLDLLVAADRLEMFTAASGDDLLRVKNFEKHQRVDNPSKPRFAGAKKRAIPQSVRRAVAAKYGCAPGCEKATTCFYCGAAGSIRWWPLSDGKPSAWVSFSLELDHVEAESAGGEGEAKNIVLACRPCNRSKGTKEFAEMWPSLTIPIESSPPEGKGKEGKGSRKGSEPSAAGASGAAPAPAAKTPDDEPEATPEQRACRRSIAERFAKEYAAKSGVGYRWGGGDRKGIIALSRASDKVGTDPAEGLRLIGIFVERMALDPYYAKNFKPRFIASEINALRMPPVARMPANRPARGPGAASGAIPVADAAKFDADEIAYQARKGAVP